MPNSRNSNGRLMLMFFWKAPSKELENNAAIME